jgi:hypothetical protein
MAGPLARWSSYIRLFSCFVHLIQKIQIGLKLQDQCALGISASGEKNAGYKMNLKTAAMVPNKAIA